MDLKNLLERSSDWPEEAQDELVAIANQTKVSCRAMIYLATRESFGS